MVPKFSALVAALLVSCLAFDAFAQQPPAPAPDQILQLLEEIRLELAAVDALVQAPVGEGQRKELARRSRRLRRDAQALDQQLRAHFASLMVVLPAPVPEPAPVQVVVQEPGMSPADHASLLQRLRGASFAADRMGVLETVLLHNRVTVIQAVPILECFTFSAERIEAAGKLLPRLVDPESAHLLLDAMQFSSDKAKLKALIQKHATGK